MSDDRIECPNCAELISPNAIMCRFCQFGISTTHFRECLSCAEMIRIDASVCRFCHSPTTPTQGTPKSTVPTLPKGKMPGWLQRMFRSDPQTTPKYGSGVRAQVFEVIVRQALAGAPWREICAGPMQVNNIDPQEVEDEVNRRHSDSDFARICDTQRPASLYGNLCNIGAANLLQSINIGRLSGKLRVNFAEIEFSAYYNAGRITHAKLGKLNGNDAVLEFVSTWKTGTFAFTSDHQISSNLTSDGCKLTMPLDRLLIDAAVAQDWLFRLPAMIPGGTQAKIERVADFETIWNKLVSTPLAYSDNTPVSDEDKKCITELIAKIDRVRKLSDLLKMFDGWPSYFTIKALTLLLDSKIVLAKAT